MEPFLTGTPIFNLGLAACALQDMGWRLSFKVSGCSVGGRSTVTRSGGDNLDGMGASSGGNTRNSVAGTGDGTTGGNPGNGTSGRAGGGCTFNPDAGFDPVLPFLIALAAGMLVVRRRAGRPT